MLFSSAAAHLLNCYSVSAQELCFCIDYGSIAVFGLTLAISFQYMTCPYHCFGVSIGVGKKISWRDIFCTEFAVYLFGYFYL